MKRMISALKMIDQFSESLFFSSTGALLSMG